MAPSFDEPQPVWEPEPLELPLDLPRRPDPAADDDAKPPRSERTVILDDEEDADPPARHPGVIVVDLC